jgi:hypothetical protein
MVTGVLLLSETVEIEEVMVEVEEDDDDDADAAQLGSAFTENWVESIDC